MQKQGRESLR